MDPGTRRQFLRGYALRLSVDGNFEFMEVAALLNSGRETFDAEGASSLNPWCCLEGRLSGLENCLIAEDTSSTGLFSLASLLLLIFIT